MAALLSLAAGFTVRAAEASDQLFGQRIRLLSDFPGGAAELESIVFDDDEQLTVVTVNIPSSLDTGWLIWWCFKLEGLHVGERIKINVTKGLPDTPARRAVWSSDGRGWQYLSSDYIFQADGGEAWFAWAVPYVVEDAIATIDKAVASCSQASSFTLAETRGGRVVPALRFGPKGGSGDDVPVVWIQARQHAWEVGSSWVADGFVTWLASDDARALALRENYVVYVVPIMDVDSVEQGEGGKNRREPVPFDHNRDWNANRPPFWPSVEAAREKLLGFKDSGRLAVFLDLHNPGWGGSGTEAYLIYEQLSDAERRTAEVFESAIGNSFTTFPFRLVDYGGKNYSGKGSASSWVLKNFPDDVVSLTLEVPVASPEGFEGKPPEHHQSIGGQVGIALHRYLLADREKVENREEVSEVQ